MSCRPSKRLPPPYCRSAASSRAGAKFLCATDCSYCAGTVVAWVCSSNGRRICCRHPSKRLLYPGDQTERRQVRPVLTDAARHEPDQPPPVPAGQRRGPRTGRLRAQRWQQHSVPDPVPDPDACRAPMCTSRAPPRWRQNGIAWSFAMAHRTFWRYWGA